MPVYEYEAIDKKGKAVNGIIDADSTGAARQKLRTTGVYPVKVKETHSRSAAGRVHAFSLAVFDQKVRSEEVYAMTRQLSTLLAAGIPLISALDALIHQVSGAGLKKVLSHVKESINEGNSLTASLSKHPKLFSNVYINMVRAGEASGALDVVLDRLADFGEHQLSLKRRFKAALVYPIFMAGIAGLVLFFLVTFIVPTITQIFVEMEQTLPLPTIVLIAVSKFMRAFWWLLLLVLFLALMALKEFIQKPRGKYLWDDLRLRLPIIGPINRKLALARFGRTLGSLLQSGAPLLASLQIVRNIVNNVLIAKVIDEAVEEIRAGKSMHSTLAQSRWFPPMVVQMISVGEQSGELENMLSKVADAYENEVEAHVLGISSMIEPVMILCMGMVVFFIVISILLPIFEMNQMIN